MKILMVNQHRDDVVGGSEIQCHMLAQRLTDLGHGVTYAVARPRRTTYDREYRCVPLAAPASLSLARLLREVRPDVVYWRFNKHGLLPAVLLAKAFGAVFVFALSHDNDTGCFVLRRPNPGGSLPRRVWRRMTSLWRTLEGALQWLGHLAVDGYVAQHRAQAARLPAARTVLIRNSAQSDAVPCVRERPFVVWVGNLKPRKRPEVFLELARALPEAGVDFVAVGARQHANFAGWERREGFPDHFDYLGAKTPAEADGLIGAARLLVLTCEAEGFPNVLIQAWSQGVPTVSLNYDPDGLIAEHGLGAVARDVGTLTEEVGAMLGDPAAREGASLRARRVAHEHFDLHRNADALLAFCGKHVSPRG